MDWEYDKIRCSGCGEWFPENEKHLNFQIYRFTCVGNHELAPSIHNYLKWFHLECCDMDSLKKIYKSKLTCDDCGEHISPYGSILMNPGVKLLMAKESPEITARVLA